MVGVKLRLICVVWVVVIVSASGCRNCTERFCETFNDSELYFENFGPTSVDTVLYEVFTKGGGLEERIDSNTLVTKSPIFLRFDSVSVIFMEQYALDQYDFRLVLPETQDTFELTSVNTKVYDCNCPGDSFYLLDEYRVNGVPKRGSKVIIP